MGLCTRDILGHFFTQQKVPVRETSADQCEVESCEVSVFALVVLLPMRSGRMNAMQFVEDLLIPKSLAIHDEYSSVQKFLNPDADRPLHVIRHGSCSSISLSLPSIPTCPGTQEKLYQKPFLSIFAEEEVFLSQWGVYALLKSVKTLEHSCCQCTHKMMVVRKINMC
ncbi:hypothetical protein TNCV_1651561 [Trichonephila clavipes]|nr:hypothetical protein TNCV_1651561 [Trichonephila clavipes]